QKLYNQYAQLVQQGYNTGYSLIQNANRQQVNNTSSVRETNSNYSSDTSTIFQPAYGLSEVDDSQNYTTNNATVATFPQGLPKGVPIPSVPFNSEQPYPSTLNPIVTVNPLLTGS